MSESELNILVIMTDQQWAGAMSCAGNDDVRTPAMDSLAAAGTRFESVYCTNPVCTPSRASMITSRMPSELGVEDNIDALPASFPARTLGHIFTEAGYDCGHGGKWHVREPSAPPSSGFRQIFPGRHAGLAAEVSRFLAEKRDRPFLAVASFNEPHGICQWARSQSPPSGDVDEPDWRDLPPLPTNFAIGSDDPSATRLVQRSSWMLHPTQDWSEERWRRYRHAYYRLCERADAEIGVLLDGMEAAGRRDDTLIVFTADHGDGLGAHRWNQKKILIEESVRVPFIVVPPSAGHPGQVCPELVSNGLDLLPTLCDYAGIPADPEWRGRSVRSLVDGALGSDTPWRDFVVAETMWQFAGGIAPPPRVGNLIGRMVRTTRFKYVCYSWGDHREQLFDLDRDPGEMVNLATSGRHQDVLAEHRRLLAGHCDQIKDGFARFIPAPSSMPR